MRARAALVLLTLLAPGLLGSMMFGGAALVWFAAPAICALPVLLIGLATPKGQPPLWGLLAIWLLLSGSWLVLGWLSTTRDLAQPGPAEAWVVLGLMLVGLGLLPLLLIGGFYARYFDRDRVSPDALRQLRTGGDP